jgi:PAS domain S-box-containing protein
MIRDVTARKLAEEALRGEKDFCQKLVQLSPTFVVAIDPNWTTTLVNHTMLSALGYRLQDVVGKDYFETFVPEPDRAGVADVFFRIACEREVTVSVNHGLTSDGRQVPTEWRRTPVFSGANYDFFIGVGMDVTEARPVAAEREGPSPGESCAEDGIRGPPGCRCGPRLRHVLSVIHATPSSCFFRGPTTIP